MKRSLRTLENLQSALSTSNDDAGAGRTMAEERRIKEAAKQRQLAKLSPYKRAEYACLECVAELRDSLREIEELQYTLCGGTSGGRPSPASVPASAGTTSREGDGFGAAADSAAEERAQLLGGRAGGTDATSSAGSSAVKRHTGAAALLEQELLRAKQAARRAHQRLQQLQRETARLAVANSAAVTAARAEEEGADAPPAGASAAVLEGMDWQQAERHVEQAKRWYRDLFGIHVVSSLADPAASSALQLNRPAQPHQSAGSMSYFSSGANALPPGVAGGATTDGVEGGGRWASGSADDHQNGSEAPHGERTADGWSMTSGSSLQQTRLRSAREDAEFQEFFATVQANDDLMDAALDRLSEGLARLLDNARGMQDELATQEELLRVTETRIDENEVALASMNRRLRRALRDMNDSSICVYVACLVVLLLILGVLLRIVR